ncbi:MAG: class I SAM-dependent methyltransferase [Chitinispirillaceae bacterium]|nr:class I SAM-dependent methyltransferase [Chitinispirillaceae bacterium]
MPRKKFRNRHYAHWLVSHISLQELKRVIPSYLKGITIDVGCGEKPYRDFFAPYAEKHYGIDFPGMLHDKRLVDLFGLADGLPLKDRSVDTVFASAVLEHLEEPIEAIKEFNRVLKPGGCVIATVPLFWHVHEEPRDFFRFTSYGITHLFSKAGFSIEIIKPMSGFWVTFGQHLSYMVLRFHKGPIKLIPVLPLIALLIQGMGFLLNTIDRSERWTWAYLVVARKD